MPFLNIYFIFDKKTRDMDTLLIKTTNYDEFSLIRGNRDTNEGHIRRLMKSLQQEQLVSFIIVNGKNEIIDGQNRFEACKRLGLPIYVYRDSKTSKYGLNQVQRYNTNNLTWNRRAYLKSYCSLGVESYLKLKEFMENYKEFGISTAVAIMANDSNGDRNKKVVKNEVRYIESRPFEEGQFQIHDLGLAYENAGKIREYGKYFPNYNSRSFVSVMLGLFKNKKFSHELMLKKLDLNPSSLVKCNTREQYKFLIENIYNYKSRDKVSLRY